LRFYNKGKNTQGGLGALPDSSGQKQVTVVK
jgi:hypothetical protein